MSPPVNGSRYLNHCSNACPVISIMMKTISWYRSLSRCLRKMEKKGLKESLHEASLFLDRILFSWHFAYQLTQQRRLSSLIGIHHLAIASKNCVRSSSAGSGGRRDGVACMPLGSHLTIVVSTPPSRRKLPSCSGFQTSAPCLSSASLSPCAVIACFLS